MIIKILTVIFALIGLRRAIVRRRKGNSLMVEFLFWASIWSAIGVVVFVPRSTDRVAHWMGVSSGFNALVFVSILGLLFAVYRLLMRTQTLERDLTRLVRAQALNSVERVAGTDRSNV